ncbi:MAG: Hsp20/alpha crystallin family protein [Desulfonatronospira sp. MSAO_Bac3]|nr:MAG: Hsp20/alpha crystallin family protein [Desulfonatronospira sp. MSAO_Bac3]
MSMSKHHNPWMEIQSMREEIDRIMDDARDWSMGRASDRDRFALWRPVADLYETVDQYIIELELPGVDQEKISLESKGGHLLVHGEKRIEKEATGSAYQLVERSYGPFSRKFQLPRNVDSAGIKAVFKNGVLTVSIPKKDTPSKSVSIKVE